VTKSPDPAFHPNLNEAVLERRVLPASYSLLGTTPSLPGMSYFLPRYRAFTSGVYINGSGTASSNASGGLAVSGSTTAGPGGGNASNTIQLLSNAGLGFYSVANTGAGALFGFNFGVGIAPNSGSTAGGGGGPAYGGESGASPAGSPSGPAALGIQDGALAISSGLPYGAGSPGTESDVPAADAAPQTKPSPPPPAPPPPSMFPTGPGNMFHDHLIHPPMR
jgi:hypothetical protein